MNSEKLKGAYDRVVAGGAILTLATVVGQAFGFLENVVLSRAFSVQAYGAVSVALTIVTVGSILAQLGLGAGAKRYISEYDPSTASEGASRVLLFSLVLTGVVGGVATLSLYLFSDEFVAFAFDDTLVAAVLTGLAAVLVSKALLDVVSNALLAKNRAGLSTLAGTLGQRSMRLAIAVGAFFAGLSLVLYGYLLSLSFLLLLGLAFLALRGEFLIPATLRDGDNLPSTLLSFSLPLFLSSIAGRVLSTADYLLIALLATTTGVGLYRPAFLVASVVTLLFRASNQVFYPVATRLHSDGERETLERLLSVFLFWTFVVAFPIFIWISLFPAQLLRTIFGQAHGLGGPVVVIVAVGMLVDVFLGPVGTILEIFEDTRPVSTSYAIAAIANIVLNVALIPPLGIRGAAFATAFSLILLNLLQYRGAVEHLPFRRRWGRFVKVVALGILLPLPLLTVPIPDFGFVLLSVPYFFIYLFTVIYIVELDEADRLLFQSVRDRVT